MSTAAAGIVVVGFCEYMRDFIVVANAIDYGELNISLLTSFLQLRSFCAFIGLCDRVRCLANTYFPGTRFLPYLPVYYWSGLLSV